MKNKIETDSFLLKTISAALSILSSLISIPDHYKNYVIPPIINSNKKSVSSNGPISMELMKKRIFESIKQFLSKSESNDDNEKLLIKTICKGVSCATVILYKEATGKSPNVENVLVSILQ